MHDVCRRSNCCHSSWTCSNLISQEWSERVSRRSLWLASSVDADLTVFVLNYGWMYAGMWQLAKRILPHTALERILFPTKSELLQFFDEDHLLVGESRYRLTGSVADFRRRRARRNGFLRIHAGESDSRKILSPATSQSFRRLSVSTSLASLVLAARSKHVTGISQRRIPLGRPYSILFSTDYSDTPTTSEWSQHDYAQSPYDDDRSQSQPRPDRPDRKRNLENCLELESLWITSYPIARRLSAPLGRDAGGDSE